MKQKTKLVMFDYDGVIMNSNHCPMIYYDILAKHIGTKKFKSWQECRAILEANYYDSLRRLDVVEQERLDHAHELFQKHCKLWKDLNIFPKIKDVLLTLKKDGYILAIVSNNTDDIIIPDLKKNKVLHFFDYIVDAKKGVKPNPDSLLYCLKLANVSPEQAVIVDDMDGGLMAAKKIKLKKAIGVSYGYQLPERLHMADIIVHAPEDIPYHVE